MKSIYPDRPIPVIENVTLSRRVSDHEPDKTDHKDRISSETGFTASSAMDIELDAEYK